VIGLATTLLLSGLGSEGVCAQGGGSAVLSSVTVGSGATGETRVVLTFDRTVPQYSIITNDNVRPAIVFSGTVRGQTARVSDAAHGLLRSISFQQNATVLVMTFTGAAPIRISATPLNARSISLSVTAATHAKNQEAGTSSPLLGVHTERKAGEDEFEVVPLKYADVSEVVGLLSSGASVKPNDAFNPQEPAFGSAGLANSNGVGNVAPNIFNPGAEQNAGAAPDALGQSVDEAIGIDRRLNAIILRGSPDLIARLKDEIAKLDVPVTSVVLETIFVELTENGAKNVGIDFNNTNSQIGVITYTSGSFNAATFGTSAGQISASLQAAIYAQVQKGEGRIISKPRIAAQSGSAAKIVTGDALPILTSIALSGVNAVSQQVQYVNVGVTLQIAPRVTEDGFVTSHIFCEVSSVTGVSQGYPTISQREASTSATVKDGESFVIGGLTQENELSTHSEIPLLGDLPLLGELFNVTRSTKSNTDLYIVITPHIVRGIGASADITRATQDNTFKSNSAANIVTPISNAADETTCADGGGAVVIENGNKGCFHFMTAAPAPPSSERP
jgi:general secretion pathway protein D